MMSDRLDSTKDDINIVHKLSQTKYKQFEHQ